MYCLDRDFDEPSRTFGKFNLVYLSAGGSVTPSRSLSNMELCPSPRSPGYPSPSPVGRTMTTWCRTRASVSSPLTSTAWSSSSSSSPSHNTQHQTSNEGLDGLNLGPLAYLGRVVEANSPYATNHKVFREQEWVPPTGPDPR